MPNQTTQLYLNLVRDFLDSSHTLATGPNKYKSKFGRILEGVFRKDYFTLQTILTLTEMVEKDPGLQIVFGGSILDLSRRVFEDMIYMEYIQEKGKEEYSDKFIQYISVDQKNDMDFLLGSGVEVKQELIDQTNEAFEKVSSDLRSRKNWAGQDIEKIIEWFFGLGKVKDSEKETMLKIYVAGNRKNHTSPSDIMDHSNEEVITNVSERDIGLGLMVTLGAAVKVALNLVEETEATIETRTEVQNIWDRVAKL